MRILDTASILVKIIPDKILDWLHDHPESNSFRGIEQPELALRRKKVDIFTDDNIGCRPDWYTDAVFAQQQFTGTNPTTITQASASWLSQFKDAARIQEANGIVDLLNKCPKDSFYVQDCSYFREAIGVSSTANIANDVEGCAERFLGATVTLYQLNLAGQIHPLSVILDYKGSIQDSVVIFNKRLTPSASSVDEAVDWPWRYAKMCAQAADWTRHEVTIHLTNAHLIEEACIVACNRTLPSSHVVYKLLQPHWFKTLSLNHAARKTLVPSVITPLTGMTERNLHAFIRHAYSTFEWSSLRIPADLPLRGFPLSELNSSPKYHNYTYARNINAMWQTLYKFVRSFLELTYTKGDGEVASDEYVQSLAHEIRSPTGAQISSFPIIDSIHSLAEAITMMIHIASPQHTAVNYSQDYYMSFLPNKPTALYTPLPTTLAELTAYKEQDLLKALPLHKPRDWLLATHLPHLLTYRVAEEQNLMTYAVSLTKVASQAEEWEVAKAAAQLYEDLVGCGQTFERNSREMDDQTKPYDVLNPKDTAVSILI
jgi:hypothetical protein